MLHYVALVWNSHDRQTALVARSYWRRFIARSPGWTTAIDQAGLCVCYEILAPKNIDCVYTLRGDTGVVLGKLFDRAYAEKGDTCDSAPSQVAMDERRSAAIIASGGRDLIDRYWGQYVAFLQDPTSQRRWVLRDPTGGVACQWTTVDGIDIYFARLEDCERLTPLSLSINSHFLRGYLAFSTGSGRETGLNEIETLLPGERASYSGATQTHDFLWNPLEIAAIEPVEDEQEAIRLTYRTVRACVHAWASCFDGILQSLSGGLDSSIVASCLKDAPTAPRVLCRHYYMTGPGADERLYARLASKSAGFELIEKELRANYKVDPTRPAPRAVLPAQWPFDYDDFEADRKFFESQGLSAEFAGNGGDELFFRGGTFPTAVDYAWLHGVNSKLFSIALNEAVIGEISIWRVLQLAYRFGIRKRRWHIRQSIPMSQLPLMNRELQREARKDPTLWHPLFRDAAGLPPGKVEHAHLVSYGAGRVYDPFWNTSAAVYLSPLMSQPFFELSLRTPLYVLKAGGRDRGIARSAFAGDVPAGIIARKSKVFGNAHAQAEISRNIELVRALLLDGYLVREGYLDRSKLEQVLSGHVSRIQSEITELSGYLEIEVWARNFSEVKPLSHWSGVPELTLGTCPS